MSEDEPRTYAGWKIGLLIVGLVTLLAVGVNLVGLATRGKPRTPGPVVTTRTP